MRFKVPINNESCSRGGGSSHGWLPLQSATHAGDAAMTTLLLEAGANVHPTGSDTHLLHIASHIEHLEITSLLLKYGADCNARDNEGNLIDCIPFTWRSRFLSDLICRAR